MSNANSNSLTSPICVCASLTPSLSLSCLCLSVSPSLPRRSLRPLSTPTTTTAGTPRAWLGCSELGLRWQSTFQISKGVTECLVGIGEGSENRPFRIWDPRPRPHFATSSLPPSLNLPTKIWPQAGISNPEGTIFRPFTYIKKLKCGRDYFQTLHLHKETQMWKGLFSDPSPT